MIICREVRVKGSLADIEEEEDKAGLT